MRDISYTSKLTHSEAGKPLALDYYILINEGTPEQYGVKIIERNSGEQAMAFDLSTDAKRVYALVDKLSRNSVTPASLMDILADWL